MNITVTEFNKAQAGILKKIIVDQKVFLPVKAPKGHAQETVNPYFLAVLRKGSTAQEHLANAQALVNELEKDEALRHQAAAQRIEVEELRDMIADAADQLRDEPYAQSNQEESDA